MQLITFIDIFSLVIQIGKDIENPSKEHVITKTLRDFIGLEDADESIHHAMSDFSYLSTTGNMDEAFKAIKVIKRSGVIYTFQYILHY